MAEIPPAIKAVEKKAALTIGANSGMRFAAAKELASQDHSVYDTARHVERMTPLTEYGMHAIKLDVADKETYKSAVEWVVAERGRIDVLMNNAGCGSCGAIEDVEIDEARRQFDVNIFGLAALTKAVLLHIRERRSGMIVNVSGMGGRLVSFMGGWHYATKYTVEALSDALHMGAAEFGINIVLTGPGEIKTEWADITAGHFTESSKGGVYERTIIRTTEGMRRQYSGKMMSNSDVVVRAISRAVNAERPRPRYLIGFGAKPLVAAHAMLPTRTSDWVMRRAVFAPSRRKPRRSQQHQPRQPLRLDGYEGTSLPESACLHPYESRPSEHFPGHQVLYTLVVCRRPSATDFSSNQAHQSSNSPNIDLRGHPTVVAGLTFAAVAALIHTYIFYPESIAWESERARVVFGTGSVEEARTTKFMAFNQGFYNLFLALLAIVGIATQAAGSSTVGLTLILVDVASTLAAAAVLLIASAPHRTTALRQGAFPSLAVGSLGLGLML